MQCLVSKNAVFSERIMLYYSRYLPSSFTEHQITVINIIVFSTTFQ